MNILQSISMAFKSIFSNKVRSLLTMLGIIIGVSSVIILVSLIQGIQKQTLESFYSFTTNHITVNYWGENSEFHEVFTKYASEELSEYVDSIAPVTTSPTPMQHGNKNLESVTLTYSGETYIDSYGYTLKQGRNIAAGDIKSRTKVAIIGSYVNKEFFSGFSNSVGQKIKILGTEYTIIGVLEEKFASEQWSQDNIILLPHSTSIFNASLSPYPTQFIVTVNNKDDIAMVTEKINTEFPVYFKGDSNTYAYNDTSWMEEVKKTNRMLTLAVGGIAGISLLVGGIGIMNIMLVSVTERTREIGIRMAIGAKRKNIIAQFLIEAAAVSGFGGIIGIMIGSVATVFIGSFITKSFILPSGTIVIGSFLFSVILGIFFGYYPANKASKLNPIDALRT